MSYFSFGAILVWMMISRVRQLGVLLFKGNYFKDGGIEKLKRF